MILTCPSCQSQYLIPDHALGADGRTVKCTHCAHKWHQAPIEDDVVHVDAEIFEPANTTNDVDDFEQERYIPPASQTSEASNPVTFKAVLLTFFLFMALAMSILTAGRQYFVEQWPPSAQLFEWVGLSVPVAGEMATISTIV